MTQQLPPLHKEDLERLRASMRRLGFDPAHPIVVDENGEILDGWHRKQVADELGLSALTAPYTGPPEDHEKRLYAIEVNIARRHLDREELKRLAMKMLPDATRRAKKRQGKRNDLTLAPNGANVEDAETEGKAAADVAKTTGLSKRTVERTAKKAKTVAKADPKAFQRYLDGEIASLANAEKEAGLKTVDEAIEANRELYATTQFDSTSDRAAARRGRAAWFEMVIDRSGASGGFKNQFFVAVDLKLFQKFPEEHDEWLRFNLTRFKECRDSLEGLIEYVETLPQKEE